MNPWWWRLALFLLCFGVVGQQAPETVLAPTKRFRKRVVVSGLASPWEVTWGPDSKLWITERTAKRIVRVDPATGARAVAAIIEDVSVPGGQDGLLGLALHPELLKGTGNDYVYASYTYVDRRLGADPHVTDASNPYRYLYLKVVRFRYSAESGRLTEPTNVITGLPAGDDHVGGRLKFGPDAKLYLTLGDQGSNQFGNMCIPVDSQRLPTRAEIEQKNYSAYAGKVLRLNLDGSVPADNPEIEGLASHVFTYGHRNTQGIDFAPDGTLYASEHGPKTDDEINILRPGGNYGWPNVAGIRDDKAYEYVRWRDARTPCAQLRFSDTDVPASVPRDAEAAFTRPMVEPIATMFTVASGYDFEDPRCHGVNVICWPTVAPSSIEHYESRGKGIPGWDRVLLVTTLKRGSIYVAPLSADGKTVSGPMWRYFRAENRYRDTAISPDLKTIYAATDAGGLVENLRGWGAAPRVENSGAILAFTYEGEGVEPEQPKVVSEVNQPVPPRVVTDGKPPQFTASQAASGKAVYKAKCAVCHGSTLTNGAYGTPLGGRYFDKAWSGRTVGEFYARAVKTMPPAAPASLPKQSYADVTAFVLEANGFRAGEVPLPPGGPALDSMVIQK